MHVTRYLSANLNIRREIKKIIFLNLFKIFLSQKDEQKWTLYKKTTYFVWNNVIYGIEEYFSDKSQENKILTMLRFNLEDSTNASGQVITPPFIKFKEDVTGQEQYHSYKMAEK